MTPDLVLAIDLGTGAVKALVVDLSGATIGRGEAPCTTTSPHPGWSEQDPAGWWHATAMAVRAATAALNTGQIAAIGLSGQMHGSVLVDRLGEPVRPAIIWSDTRSATEVQEITAAIGREPLIEIAGSPLATGFQAATVRWVQRHEPGNWIRTDKVLLPKDYLRYGITGVYRTEPSDAASTLLLDARTRQWSATLLTATGVADEQLPELLPSDQISGYLQPAAAAHLGLPAGLPVCGGGGDAPLAAIAAGVVDPGSMLLTISTGSQAIVPSATFLTDAAGRIHTWCSVLPASQENAAWYQMGATMASGLTLRWLRDQVFRLDPATGYDTLITEAILTPPGARGLLFLPYLNGERTPHMDPLARGIFLGLTTDHHRGHLTRAAIEGSVMATYDAFTVLQSLGAAPTSIVLAGGGARSPLWQQTVADLFGLPVRPLLQADGSAMGAAMLAAAAANLVSLPEAIATWPQFGEVVTPTPAATSVYRSLMPIFRRAYTTHRDDFRLLHAIGETDGVP